MRNTEQSEDQNTSNDQKFKKQQTVIIEQLAADLINPESREHSLHQLSKNWVLVKDMAPILWNSFGTITVLLQEVVSIYPFLDTSGSIPSITSRVYDALALFQCFATHSTTRPLFLNAYLPLYVYPLISTERREQQFEFLRLISLGIIGALVKEDDREVIWYLLHSAIIPRCLSAMENGYDLSKTVATFILQKILSDDRGFQHICARPERFFSIENVLRSQALFVVQYGNPRLLRDILRCYHRLSDEPRACTALRTLLPGVLCDGTLSNHFQLNLCHSLVKAPTRNQPRGIRVSF